MATHLSRRDLKQDAFSARVQGSVISLTQHKREVVRYGGIALAVILVAAGVWYFRSAQTSVRQQSLGEAMTVYTGTIGGNPAPGVPNYPTEAAKDDAVTKAFTKITIELRYGFRCAAQTSCDKAARGDGILLTSSHQTFDEGTQLFGLRDCRHDAILKNERARQ